MKHLVESQEDVYAIEGGESLQDGDLLTEINGTTIGSMDQLRKVYDAVAVGADLTLTVERAGKSISKRGNWRNLSHIFGAVSCGEGPVPKQGWKPKGWM